MAIIAKKGFYQRQLVGENVVIGNATSGKWDEETAMEYNPKTRLWTVVTTLLQGKEILFRSDDRIRMGVAADEETKMGGVLGDYNTIKIVAKKDTPIW